MAVVRYRVVVLNTQSVTSVLSILPATALRDPVIYALLHAAILVTIELSLVLLVVLVYGGFINAVHTR